MTKAILFDLDGTLLPMDLHTFQITGAKLFAEKMTNYGFDFDETMRANMEGIMAMTLNDGRTTNDKVFYEAIAPIFGERITEAYNHIKKYYENEFEEVKNVCGYNPQAAEVVRFLKEKGYRLVLATTPWFPASAIEKRIRWAGLEPEVFEFYSTMDVHSYCKPKPEYYMEVLDKTGLKAEECLMVGNDATEDMAAEAAGMKVFLLTDCLVNKKNVDISRYPQGSFDDLIKYIDFIEQN